MLEFHLFILFQNSVLITTASLYDSIIQMLEFHPFVLFQNSVLITTASLYKCLNFIFFSSYSKNSKLTTSKIACRFNLPLLYLIQMLEFLVQVITLLATTVKVQHYHHMVSKVPVKLLKNS